MNFLDGEYSKAIGQYMVIGVVVSILLTIKYFAMKKSYEKKLGSLCIRICSCPTLFLN